MALVVESGLFVFCLLKLEPWCEPVFLVTHMYLKNAINDFLHQSKASEQSFGNCFLWFIET